MAVEPSSIVGRDEPRSYTRRRKAHDGVEGSRHAGSRQTRRATATTSVTAPELAIGSSAHSPGTSAPKLRGQDRATPSPATVSERRRQSALFYANINAVGVEEIVSQACVTRATYRHFPAGTSTSARRCTSSPSAGRQPQTRSARSPARSSTRSRAQASADARSSQGVMQTQQEPTRTVRGWGTTFRPDPRRSDGCRLRGESR